jgi:hypothetical protein
MKGFIHIYNNGSGCFYLTIETIHLYPLITPVINANYASYTSKIFVIKKITNIDTKESFDKISSYQVGQVKVGDINRIFKTFKALKLYYFFLFNTLKNGYISYYQPDGFKSSLVKKENFIATKCTYYSPPPSTIIPSSSIISPSTIIPPSYKIINNLKKNKTTISYKSDTHTRSIIYPAIIYFYQNEFDNNKHNLHQISEKAICQNNKLRIKSYTREGVLAKQDNFKNEKKHHIIYSNGWRFLIYQNGREISNNLQSLLHAPFNYNLSKKILIF